MKAYRGVLRASAGRRKFAATASFGTRRHLGVGGAGCPVSTPRATAQHGRHPCRAGAEHALATERVGRKATAGQERSSVRSTRLRFSSAISPRPGVADPLERGWPRRLCRLFRITGTPHGTRTFRGHLGCVPRGTAPRLLAQVRNDEAGVPAQKRLFWSSLENHRGCEPSSPKHSPKQARRSKLAEASQYG